jgi:hypothetical protein
MKQPINLVLLAIALGIAISSSAENQPHRIPISAERVAGAMMDAGWNVSAAQVKMLPLVTVEASAPWLQVARVTHWQDDRLKVQLHCRDSRACLPFFVLIDRHGLAEATPASTEINHEQAEVAANHPEFDTPVEAFLVRSGDPAKMQFAQKGLSITMPVICLQSGRQGQTIRVASADHKRFFKAEIVASGLLKAVTL